MTSKYLIFIASLLVFTSCNYEEDFFDETDGFIEQDDNFPDDDGGFPDDGGDFGGEATLSTYRINGDEIIKIKDFNVSSNLLPYQQDEAKHLAMFDFYTRLIPRENRHRIVEFEVFYGNNDLAGYVVPIDNDDLSRWKMGLAIETATDITDIDFTNFFTYLTLHEFGHVLTLNESQVNVFQGNCSEYHTGEGCSNANSYINQLFELGWEDIAPNGEGGGDLYNRHSDRFVSDYAATNPGEDVAEVFATFITEGRRGGNSIADQKVNQMFDRPELVDMRDKIVSQISTLQDGGVMTRSWREKFKFSCGHRH